MAKQKKIKFSIIIPVKEINDYIRESIPIILNIDYEDYEIIILPNEEPAKIPDYLKDEKIKIAPTGMVSPAIKRDIGAKKSLGKYLAFIDDDAYPRKDWLSVAEKTFEEKGTAAICGPAITPSDDSLLQKASGLVFETMFGGGGMDYRYKPAKSSFYVEDFPSVNLIVSKKAFLDIGGFDNDFWPGEDTKFCLELIKRGEKIWYSNELIVYHHRRKLFLPHLKQIGNYGKHRGYFARKYPKNSFKLGYFIPSLFMLDYFLLFILGILNPSIFKIWIALIIIYFVLVAADVLLRTFNPILAILAIIAVFLTHLVYGAMFIKGFLSKNLRSQLR